MVIVGWNMFGLLLSSITIKLCFKQNHSVLSSKGNQTRKLKKTNVFVAMYKGWKAYSKSGVLLMSIATGMTWFNLLCGGDIVNAYLKFRGISYFTLGVTKGCGALFGLFGTFITPCLHSGCGFGMDLIGTITIWTFWLSLMPIGVGDIIFGGNNKLIPYIMLGSMILARTSVWALNLAKTQLMQTLTRKEVRGQINACNQGMAQFFSLIITGLTLIFHRVDQFFIVAWVVLSSLFLSAVLFTIWYIFPCCKKDRYVIDNQSNNNDNNNN